MTHARRVLLVGVCTLWLGAVSGWSDTAATPQPSQDRVDAVMGRYLHPPLAKFGRGVSNVLGGWLEVPVNIQQRYATTDTAGSLVTGAVYGLIKGLVRTGVGVYETATFFLPCPKHFAPILPTLAYFQRDTKRQSLPLEY